MATNRRTDNGTAKTGSDEGNGTGDVLPVAAPTSPPPSARPHSEEPAPSVVAAAEENAQGKSKSSVGRENSIRPSRSRARAEPSRPAAAHAQASTRARDQPDVADSSNSGAPNSSASPDTDTRQSPDRWAVPEEVKERFVSVGRSYYFADGARAFQDRGKRLVSDTENTEVIRSLLKIAQERGWTDITVSGTERFRSEVWQQGQRAGLRVRGHRPSEAEKVRLARDLAQQQSNVAPGASALSEPADPTMRPPGRSRAIREKDALTTGQLLQHGPATYRFDPREQPSYYVKLRTATGERVLWGKDLERAIAESVTRVQVGDEIGVRPVRREAVQVRTAERDESGEVIGERKIDTHRNRWVVESKTFFEARSAAASAFRDPRVEPTHVAQQHPELVSEYVKLRGAELVADQRIANPADRRQFVAQVRERLAAAFERGGDPQPVYLQNRRSRELLHADREPDRTRG